MTHVSSSATSLESSQARSAPAGPNTPAFWERLWRLSGLNFILFFVAAAITFGYPPHVGASADELLAFYTADRTRILIASVLAGLAVLNLLWFAAALRTDLAESGQEGWGGAATAASAAVGAVCILLITMAAALAYSIAPGGNHALAPGLHDLTWAGVVMSSFPRAMLIMSGSFGLWRARRISNGQFGAGVAAVVLVLAGGTTWSSAGFWAPDGPYSQFVSPIIGMLWIVAVTRVLLARGPGQRQAW